MLVRQDLTTYEYILQEQRKELEDLQTAQQSSISANDKADDDGPLCVPCAKGDEQQRKSQDETDDGAAPLKEIELAAPRKPEQFQLEIVDSHDQQHVPLGAATQL